MNTCVASLVVSFSIGVALAHALIPFLLSRTPTPSRNSSVYTFADGIIDLRDVVYIGLHSDTELKLVFRSNLAIHVLVRCSTRDVALRELNFLQESMTNLHTI